jgi:hypothetical protein
MKMILNIIFTLVKINRQYGEFIQRNTLEFRS